MTGPTVQTPALHVESNDNTVDAVVSFIPESRYLSDKPKAFSESLKPMEPANLSASIGYSKGLEMDISKRTQWRSEVLLPLKCLKLKFQFQLPKLLSWSNAKASSKYP